VAPVQVVIVPVVKDEDRSLILEKCNALAAVLRKVQYSGEGVRVKVDEREGLRPGFKFADWELRGVPLRLEVGPRDIAEGTAILVNRLSGEKKAIQVDYATPALDGESISSSLSELQAAVRARAEREMTSRVFEVGTYDGFREIIAEGRGFAVVPYDGTAATEAKVKEETSATVRVLLSRIADGSVKCLFTGQPAAWLACFATSY
jgi:prolyl-tRNA synthetase